MLLAMTLHLCQKFSGSKLNPSIQRTRKQTQLCLSHGWSSVYAYGGIYRIKLVSLILDTNNKPLQL